MLAIAQETIEISNGTEATTETVLYAYSGEQRIGKIINTVAPGLTGLTENPGEDASLFAAVYSGHGDIYHVSDNPPNPFFNSSWSEVFENPEFLPVGTANVFIDESQWA